MSTMNLWSFGFVLLSAGYFVRSVQVLFADPLVHHPSVSKGSFPYVQFTGSGINPTVTTISSTSDFLITTAIMGSNCDLLADGSLIVKGESEAMSTQNDFALATGLGHLLVKAGSTVSIDGNCTYFIEGYEVEQGSPYRSFSGEISGPGTSTMGVLSSDFLITTAIVDTTSVGVCNIEMDGVTLVDGVQGLMHFTNYHSPFHKGRAHVKAMAGSTLRMKNQGSYCQYYVEGTYIP